MITETETDKNSKNISNNFITYIDICYRNTELLPKWSINLYQFTQNDRNMLLSAVPFQFDEYYVPLYCRYLSNLVPGILLDIPKFHSLCSESLNKDTPAKNTLFSEKHLNTGGITSLSRISVVQDRLRSRVCNLDEIVPIIDELHDRNNEEVQIVEEADVSSQLQNQMLMLDPLRLNSLTRQEKHKLKQSEHNKLARITIMYTLAFFALALITFFIIYLA